VLGRFTTQGFCFWLFDNDLKRIIEVKGGLTDHAPKAVRTKDLLLDLINDSMRELSNCAEDIDAQEWGIVYSTLVANYPRFNVTRHDRSRPNLPSNIHLKPTKYHQNGRRCSEKTHEWGKSGHSCRVSRGGLSRNYNGSSRGGTIWID
jgi:hypothetical protein